MITDKHGRQHVFLPIPEGKFKHVFSEFKGEMSVNRLEGCISTYFRLVSNGNGGVDIVPKSDIEFRKRIVQIVHG